jgi:3'-phosphoadenosine 5'-phosphosulfate sulfotransferase (PAPS reductase)/FAD synthetase
VRGLSTDVAESLTETLRQAAGHERLVLLCSFQKEESVILDELREIAPHARVVTIDTGVLFAETVATWRAFEERFGMRIDAEEALGDWTGPEQCCGDAKVAALERALAGADAWITGLRREQGPTRRDREVQPARALDRARPVDADPRARPALQPAPRRGLRVDRLRAVHASRQRARGALERHRQDRVRAARVVRRAMTFAADHPPSDGAPS